MSKKSWKFHYHKAIGDYPLSNAERATLTAIWDYADADTGKCWPTDAQINEKCNRSRTAKISQYKKKFVELGLLTIAGHGRKSVYFLNKSVLPYSQVSNQVSNDDGQVSNDDLLSQSPLRTNRSSNTSTKRSGAKTPRQIYQEGEELYLSLDGYILLDKPWPDVKNWFWDFIKEEDNIPLMIFLIKTFSSGKMSSLTSKPYTEARKSLMECWNDPRWNYPDETDEERVERINTKRAFLGNEVYAL